MSEVFNNRRDLHIIANLIGEGARVLDLGCGDGSFLRYLQENRKVHGLGLEKDQKAVARCIANGVSVIQRDLNTVLDFADDGSFDYVILSHTLQELKNPELMLKEIVRVGEKAIVSFINFGYIENRLQLMFTGRMPRNKYVPNEWYNTPNIHLGTIDDFKNLCSELDISILNSIAIGKTWDAPANFWHNLLAPGCVFVLT